MYVLTYGKLLVSFCNPEILISEVKSLVDSTNCYKTELSQGIANVCLKNCKVLYTEISENICVKC